MKEIEAADDLELQLIVTGMHLSPEFGLTYKQIELDGFKIDRKVEMLLSSDSPTGISKSMGLGMIGFADALAGLEPDLLIVLGDRFEIFSAVSAATARATADSSTITSPERNSRPNVRTAYSAAFTQPPFHL